MISAAQPFLEDEERQRQPALEVEGDAADLIGIAVGV